MHAPRSFGDWVCMTAILQKVPNNSLNEADGALGHCAECDKKMANKCRSKYAYSPSESSKVDSCIAWDLLQSPPIL